MSFGLKVHDNFLTKSTCEELIKLHGYVLADRLNYITYHDEQGFVNHSFIEKADERINKIVQIANANAQVFIEDYLKVNSDLSQFHYKFENASLIVVNSNGHIPHHHDPEIFAQDGEVKLGHFSILCYLNQNFDGGEVVFPSQDFRLKPKTGTMLIFPNSFLFPHFVAPVFGNTRYALRLNYGYTSKMPKETKIANFLEVKCTSCDTVSKFTEWSDEEGEGIHFSCPECDVEVHKNFLRFQWSG